MSKDHQQKLSHDNVTRTYQKATPKLEASINRKHEAYLKLARESNALQRHMLL